MSIAAASIIAKTTRDRMMLELSRDYPDYYWQSNKGYAAPAHRDALNRCGVIPHHRRSFSPIHKMLYDGVSDNLLETTC
jgi:ribonuclease HII